MTKKMVSAAALALLIPMATLAGPCASKNDLALADGCQMTADLAYQEGYGLATVKAFPATGPGPLSLQNVVIVVSGFDPRDPIFDDGRNPKPIDELLLKINQYGLANRLRGAGYDVVIMHFGLQSGDYIQNNAMAVIKVLQTLERYRAGGQPMVVAGLSMGGLIARYALAFMEKNGMPHHVRTYISYDSPHQGANIPVGAQQIPDFLDTAFTQANKKLGEIRDAGVLLAYPIFAGLVDPFHLNGVVWSYGASLAYDQAAGATTPMLDAAAGAASDVSATLLNSVAPRQQLINFYRSETSDPLRTQLLSELATLGYPQKTRNVAFTNGSAQGNMAFPLNQARDIFVTIFPGTPLLSYYGETEETVGGYKAKFSLNVAATQAQPSPGRDFYGALRGPVLVKHGIFFPPTVEIGDYAVRPTYASPYHKELDGVPGSYATTLLQLADKFNDPENGVPFPRMVPTIPVHSFVPTYSALDIDLNRFGNSPTTNFVQYASANGISDIAQLTPFSRVYFPSNGNNEAHLEVTAEKSDQLFTEVTARTDLQWLVPVISTILE